MMAHIFVGQRIQIYSHLLCALLVVSSACTMCDITSVYKCCKLRCTVRKKPNIFSLQNKETPEVSDKNINVVSCLLADEWVS